MREDFEKRQTYLASEENSNALPVPENLKKFMESIKYVLQFAKKTCGVMV